MRGFCAGLFLSLATDFLMVMTRLQEVTAKTKKPVFVWIKQTKCKLVGFGEAWKSDFVTFGQSQALLKREFYPGTQYGCDHL